MTTDDQLRMALAMRDSADHLYTLLLRQQMRERGRIRALQDEAREVLPWLLAWRLFDGDICGGDVPRR